MFYVFTEKPEVFIKEEKREEWLDKLTDDTADASDKRKRDGVSIINIEKTEIAVIDR